MAITFKTFQSKAEQIDVHPEHTEHPWTYATMGLLSESARLSKTLTTGLPNGEFTIEERKKAIDSAWKLLWFLTAACRYAGTSLEEAAERGLVELDKIGDDFLPPTGEN
jgi:hypothetical protein